MLYDKKASGNGPEKIPCTIKPIFFFPYYSFPNFKPQNQNISCLIHFK